uniref:Uncharacterized protein TCIL3000_10_1990 n=1 Tax=Trypanosoma congolense (strain IL3000) TaxID=1068625 RepID=G0UVM4_TRYCI|nr:unnamed protein product [Trypanosoma congolense IL3000]
MQSLVGNRNAEIGRADANADEITDYVRKLGNRCAKERITLGMLSNIDSQLSQLQVARMAEHNKMERFLSLRDRLHDLFSLSTICHPVSGDSRHAVVGSFGIFREAASTPQGASGADALRADAARWSPSPEPLVGARAALLPESIQKVTTATFHEIEGLRRLLMESGRREKDARRRCDAAEAALTANRMELERLWRAVTLLQKTLAHNRHTFTNSALTLSDISAVVTSLECAQHS